MKFVTTGIGRLISYPCIFFKILFSRYFESSVPPFVVYFLSVSCLLFLFSTDKQLYIETNALSLNYSLNVSYQTWFKDKCESMKHAFITFPYFLMKSYKTNMPVTISFEKIYFFC